MGNRKDILRIQGYNIKGTDIFGVRLFEVGLIANACFFKEEILESC